MLSIKEVIIVEGRYDRCKLSQLVNAEIVETSGFSIFNDSQLRNYIYTLAEKRGIIILTDSDAAGFQIRNYIKSFVPEEYIKNAYIPDLYGKEKRKRKATRENKLGVEGVPDEVLINALNDCGASQCMEEDSSLSSINKTDFYILGLTGRENSSLKRKALTDYLNLPERISTNDLISYINATMDINDFKSVCNAVGII